MNKENSEVKDLIVVKEDLELFCGHCKENTPHKLIFGDHEYHGDELHHLYYCNGAEPHEYDLQWVPQSQIEQQIELSLEE